MVLTRRYLLVPSVAQFRVNYAHNVAVHGQAAGQPAANTLLWDLVEECRVSILHRVPAALDMFNGNSVVCTHQTPRAFGSVQTCTRLRHESLRSGFVAENVCGIQGARIETHISRIHSSLYYLCHIKNSVIPTEHLHYYSIVH